MTLKEFAGLLGKAIKFEYITVSRNTVDLWSAKPEWQSVHKWWDSDASVACIEKPFVDLDLSEYTDEEGEISYNKCIIKVEGND